MKPTQEQAKEFWEWCGFTWWEQAGAWCFGKSEVSRELPPIDLNSLFEYAVPKVDYAELNYDYRQSDEGDYKITHSDFIYTAIISLDVYDEFNATYEDTDPALALFWALWEVVNIRG